MTELPSKSEGTPASRRNLEITRRLDPSGMLLPKADMLISASRLDAPTRHAQGSSLFPTDGSRDVYLYLFRDDVNIGFCRLERSDLYKTFTTEWVAIHEDYQRQGYAKQFHMSMLKALPDNYELRSDSRARPAVWKIWRWLETNGLAEPINIVEEEYFEHRYITTLQQMSLN